MLVYSQQYDESAMSDLKRMVESEPDGASADFDALPPDADDATRQRVAETLAPQLARNLADHPWLMEPAEHQSTGPRATQETFVAAVTELYNQALLDVLGRASALAVEQVGPGAAGRGAEAAPAAGGAAPAPGVIAAAPDGAPYDEAGPP